MINGWLVSDITMTTDSEGFISAEHKYQGDLIIDGYYDSQADCKRDAVNVLKDKKEEHDHQYKNPITRYLK